MTATMQQTPWVGRAQARFPIISFRPIGWCMHVNDSVTNTALSMSTLLTALHICPSNSKGPRTTARRSGSKGKGTS